MLHQHRLACTLSQQFVLFRVFRFRNTQHLARRTRQLLQARDGAHRRAHGVHVLDRFASARAHLQVVELVVMPTERAERALLATSLDSWLCFAVDLRVKVTRLAVD